MFKSFTAVMAATAFIALPVTAAPVKMTQVQLDQVVAGTFVCPPPETKVKGNNGWGNGPDDVNPGSGAGATAPSKSANASQPEFGKINTEPQERFTGR